MCARVDFGPGFGYYFIATYHNFAESYTGFNVIYNSSGSPTIGLAGEVVARNYIWGTDKQYPLLDCALIRLDSTSPSAIQNDLFQSPGQPGIPLRGAGNAAPGMMVKKYGMTTGMTYGIVVPLPTNYADEYDDYLFCVEPCDQFGCPISGNFDAPADSGAPATDMNGYVLGMVIQSATSPDGNMGLAIISRIN